MVNIDELYRTVQFFANKEQSGFITPSEFNLLADRAQMEMFMKKFGNPEAVVGPMQPYPKYSYQETQKITDDLRPFVKRINLNLNFGQLQYPEDYVHFASLMAVRFVNIAGTSNSIPRHIEIQAVDESELGYMLGSDIVYPEPDYPVVAFYDNYMQVYPIETSNVIFTYLRRPVKPLWAFDIVNNRPVYNDANSVDIEFPDETLNEIAMKILSYVGINLREPSLMQYSETQKNAGL
jgi:hypothetical protein